MKKRNTLFFFICLGIWLILSWLCWLAADRSSGMVSLLKQADALTFACFVLFAAFWVISVITATFFHAQGWLLFAGCCGLCSIAAALLSLVLPLFDLQPGVFAFLISWFTAPYFGLTHAAQDVLRIGLLAFAALVATGLPWLMWATIKPHRRSIYPADEPEDAPAPPQPAPPLREADGISVTPKVPPVAQTLRSPAQEDGESQPPQPPAAP